MHYSLVDCRGSPGQKSNLPQSRCATLRCHFLEARADADADRWHAFRCCAMLQLSLCRNDKLIRCYMATLGVFDVNRWLQQPRPAELHVSQPYQVACWSKSSIGNGGETCHGDTAGLHPFKAPKLPADLSNGYPEAYTPKDEEARVGVEPVAAAVAKVDACMLGHTMHLDIHKTPRATFPNAELFQYYGYRFEALSTQQTSVDATSEYVAVIRLRLDKLRIVMAAEVDCYDANKVNPGQKPDLASYLELKTYIKPEDQQKAANVKKYKYPKWWLQSWLAGVPFVIAGARDRQGWLQSIETLPTRQLPHLAAEANVGFDPWQQIHFGRDVLTWMQQLTGDQKGKHLQFSYQEEAKSHAIRCKLVDPGSLADRLRSCLQ